MSWKKHFTEVPTSGRLSPVGSTSANTPGPAKMNYSSFLPDVYAGAPNRVERYQQMSQMDMDSEVNAALDILAEFCTQLNKQNNTPFGIDYTSRATNTETKVLMEYLQQWCKAQEFDIRIFRIVRNLFMYGDAIFIRDPETFKWMWVDPGKVTRVIVNESQGKKPEQYIIRDLSINFQKLIVTQINPNTQNQFPGGAGFVSGGAGAKAMVGAFPQTQGSRFSLANNEHAIAAEHIVHLSLSEGLDNFFPFGQSLLESVFKVYKQKELLEDAILIYRIQRAPERRIFYVDVGEMPSHLAMSFVERVKNEIHQRRIPSASGTGYGSGSSSVIDSSYNPMSINEDYYFPISSNGRGSRVETLPGGCLAMDTRVSLLDGRELSISEIADEMVSGKELWTYSCHPITGDIKPGLITWAGITQQSAKVMKITLDNGESLVCTPCHKFPIYEHGFKRADELSNTDRIIGFDTINILNHTSVHISTVEVLDEITVGTLTIDGDEIYHDYHTFALSIGIFTKNSNLDQIDDLRHFTNKMMRALRIPSSYLPTGPEDSQANYTDGRVGTAYIQELRFNKYCERLQRMMTPVFDREFKLYLKQKGVNIDFSLFKLTFQPPQNFAAYRQAELDNQRISTFNQMAALPFISKRYALKRFLGLTEDEIAENERLWKEEAGQGSAIKTDAASEMRSVGVTPAGIEADMGAFTEPEQSPADESAPEQPPVPPMGSPV